MTFKRFKEIYKLIEIGSYQISFENNEYNDYVKAIHHEPEFHKWYLRSKIRSSHLRIGKHCCVEMEYYLIEYYKEKKELKVDSKHINYDSVVIFDKSQKCYGIPIHDGGNSYIKIKYCPWCGSSI